MSTSPAERAKRAIHQVIQRLVLAHVLDGVVAQGLPGEVAQLLLEPVLVFGDLLLQRLDRRRVHARLSQRLPQLLEQVLELVPAQQPLQAPGRAAGGAG